MRHRTIGDRLGEAKASGNLGNTLKVLGKFNEAIACCQRHLDISRELSDKVQCFCYSFELLLLFASYTYNILVLYVPVHVRLLLRQLIPVQCCWYSSVMHCIYRRV